MAKAYRPYRFARPALSLWTQPEPVAPPSAEVVAAVLALGDIRADCEDGRVSIRMSPERAAHPEVALMLGEDGGRALDVTVIYDEGEDEIVRVLDVAPLRAGEAATAKKRNAYAEARMRGATPLHAAA